MLEIIKPQNVQNLIHKFCFTIGMLPTSFKESLTYEEQILCIGNYLETTVYPAINNNANALKELQQLFIDLKDYVDHYFDDLDIQEEINNKLDEMIEDGTLDEIINQQIFGELNTRIDNISSLLNKTIKFPTTNIGLERIFRFIDESSIQSMQGGCVTPYNTVIVAMWDSATDNNKIMEINYLNGSIVKSINVNFGYCNGLTYDTKNNLVYVVPRGSSTVANQKTIYVLNYNDFSTVSTIQFSDYIQSISFDKTTEKLYIMNEWGLRTQNGFKIYEVNPTGFTIENTISIDYLSNINKLRIQNFAVVGNYIYIISSEPRALIVYDLEGNLIQLYNLPEYISKIYYSGEYQFVDYYDGQLYVGSGDNVSDNIESINQLFKLNLQNQYVTGDQNENVVHAGASYVVYVNSSSSSINPDGSETNPFKSINEATRYETTNRACNIQIANGTYNGVYIRSRDHISFNGTAGSVIIKGFNIGYCNHVVIDGANVQDCQFLQNGVINLHYADVYLKNLNITDSGSLYGIYVGNFSSCNLSISISINVAIANQIYVRNDSVLFTNSTSYNIQKHQKSSKIIGEGKPKLFDTDIAGGVGEFTIPTNWSYTDYNFSQYFDRAIINYTVGGNYYTQIVKLQSTRTPTYLEKSLCTGSGTQTTSQVMLDFYNNTLRLRYSRVYTRTASGTCTGQINENNDALVDNSVIVTNIYFE